MKRVASAALLLALGLSACGVLEPEPILPRWQPQSTGVDSSLRGLCVVSDEVVWASGAQGSVLRTIDGGESWERLSIEGAAELDFRSIYAFDAERALVLSAGEPARMYRTENGGADWSLAWECDLRGAFFDALAFWDRHRGMAFSDPVGGGFLVVKTVDGGESWERVSLGVMPQPLEGEAGFAASGTCLRVAAPRHVWIGTGGGASARVLSSRDGGASWSVAQVPLAAGRASAGVFSLAFADERLGVAVGGDYKRPELWRAPRRLPAMAANLGRKRGRCRAAFDRASRVCRRSMGRRSSRSGRMVSMFLEMAALRGLR